MQIDSKGEITLARYKGRIVKTDHRMLKLEIDLEFHANKKHDRSVVFNVRNQECQKLFCEFTSRGNTFSRCFSSEDEPLDIQFKRWKRLFNKALNSCFRKIRIKVDNKKKPSKIDELMEKRKSILKKKSFSIEDETEINKIEHDISDEIADKELEKLERVLGELDTTGNGTNYTNVWKELRKAYPKNTQALPTGVKNFKGKLITNPNETRPGDLVMPDPIG